jgi:hypothetical protein
MGQLSASTPHRFLLPPTNAALLLKISGLLWVLSCVPIFISKALPFQDLPNHMASMSIVEHLSSYPEFASTGLLKTNSALFAILTAARAFGLSWTASSKLAAIIVLGASAFTFPRVLHRLGGTEALYAGSVFLLPLVHGWFLQMGMLDFALSIPLALECVLASEQLLQGTSRKTVLRLIGFALLTFYAHIFGLCIFLMLAVLELPRRRSNQGFRTVLLTLLVPLLLTAATVLAHLTEKRAGETFQYKAFLPPWETMYNAWAECCAGYTKLGLSSLLILVPLLALVRQRRAGAAWFRAPALIALGLLTCFGPYIVTAWFYVANRFAPFLWIAVLVNLQIVWPRWALRGFTLGSALFFAGLCVDTRRLSAEHTAVQAAMLHVPVHAKLLPLMMQPKGSSEHTRHLLQAWGYYVLERQVSAPLLFAHSRAFPVVTKQEPPAELNHLALERLAMHGNTESAACKEWGPLDGSCAKRFAATWEHFWEGTARHFDYVLLQGPPSKEVQSFIRGTTVYQDATLSLIRMVP